jgi:hypothetical protein
MTQRQATAIALHPGPRRQRERDQCERYIVRNFMNAEDRALYKKVRAHYGYAQWDWLRQALSTAYQ